MEHSGSLNVEQAGKPKPFQAYDAAWGKPLNVLIILL